MTTNTPAPAMAPPPGASDPALAEIRKSLSAAETRIAEQRESSSDEETRRRGRDRSQIARLIVWLFAVAVVLVLVALPALAFTIKDGEFWNRVVERLVTFVASVLLPVVTLVIGYYFGTEQLRKSDDRSDA